MINRLIGGYVVTLFGLALIILSIWSGLWILIYGIPALIIGIVILLNSNEDKIERIKYGKKKK